MDEQIKAFKTLADTYARNRDLYFANANRLEEEAAKNREHGNQFAGAYDAVITVLAIMSDPTKFTAILNELNGEK